MRLREWATPLAMGSFALIAVTGGLMFFHLDRGLNKTAHEWLGWGMIVAVALHAAANLAVFKRYFSSRAALAIIGAFVIALAASFLPPPGGAKPKPHILATRALLEAPLPVVAQVAGLDGETLLSRLRAAGFEASIDGSLRLAAGESRDRQMQALGAVFAR